MSGHESAVARLRSEGYRMTPQRLSVLDIVANRPGHIGADEVWNLAKEQHPYVDLATIYRTLQLLKRLGVVTEVVIGNKLHFELADHHNRPQPYGLFRMRFGTDPEPRLPGGIQPASAAGIRVHARPRQHHYRRRLLDLPPSRLTDG